ncbi:hypothetical protein BCD48_27050 [Pseudofrankia sp. BMG5.36]|nr:hypothetical protein BCD48_27050 [Pseudofrankia sp. BMG5.36]
MVGRLWEAVGDDPSTPPAEIRVQGPEGFLPSVFDVTGFASAAVAVAALAIADLLALIEGRDARAVTVERRAASAAFLAESLFTPVGWERQAIWDPIAGDYRTADGWIRLHTNYRHHREAVERVLGLTGRGGGAVDRATVTAVVAGWPGDDLETAVARAGGCAAVQRDRIAWLASEPGAAGAAEPLVRLEPRPATGAGSPNWAQRRPGDSGGPRSGRSGGAGGEPGPRRPLAGLRVLDLTRVIAGPVATRWLAAYGADVVRIDPVGFAEVPALLPVMTAGKRRAALDLRAADGRAAFAALVADADVLVCGLRSDALDRLGFGPRELLAANPDLVVARLDAYGWSGPWATRRGFDSLVQMSCGITAAGAAAAGHDAPRPLPAQALDHGTGYLLAAAVLRAVHRLARTGEASLVTASLVGTANVLMSLPAPDGLAVPAPRFSPDDTEPVRTAWGDGRGVPVPGAIDGLAPDLAEPAGPLGSHAPVWLPR